MLPNVPYENWSDEDFNADLTDKMLFSKRKMKSDDTLEEIDFKFTIKRIEAQDRHLSSGAMKSQVHLINLQDQGKGETNEPVNPDLPITSASSQVYTQIRDKNPDINIIDEPAITAKTQSREQTDNNFIRNLVVVKKRSFINMLRTTIMEFLRFGVIFTASFGFLTLVFNLPAYAKIFNTEVWGSTSTQQLQALVATGVQKTVPKNTFNLFNKGVGSNVLQQINLNPTIASFHLFIPTIGINAPIKEPKAFDLSSGNFDIFEEILQKALQKGVVHYPSTALPNQAGNVVITGHSSYYFWDQGQYKDIFATLHQVKIGAEIYIYLGGKKYTYRVRAKNVVLPNVVNVLDQTKKNQLTLITCTPVGTSLKRLIVIADLVNET